MQEASLIVIVRLDGGETAEDNKAAQGFQENEGRLLLSKVEENVFRSSQEDSAEITLSQSFKMLDCLDV